MTIKECAAHLDGNTFDELFELTEPFLLGMQQNRLCLAFCPGINYFHVIGAHNEILGINPDAEQSDSIHIFRDAAGGYNFRVVKEHDAIAGGSLIRLHWGPLGSTAGYTLSWDLPGEQVTLTDSTHICKGLLFSLGDLA